MADPPTGPPAAILRACPESAFRPRSTPRHAVWRRLADIADHVSWMADAASIRFTGDQRSGVGTTFECETRGSGPLRTLDLMEVTEWPGPRHLVGMQHRGFVTGTGPSCCGGAAGTGRS